MLNDFLSKQTDCDLWQLLADIASIMQNRQHKNSTNIDNFWICCANEVKKEIDRRLFDESEKG